MAAVLVEGAALEKVEVVQVKAEEVKVTVTAVGVEAVKAAVVGVVESNLNSKHHPHFETLDCKSMPNQDRPQVCS